MSKNSRARLNSDRGTYVNVEDSEVDYVNAPSSVRQYHRQISDPSRRPDVSDDLRNSDSSSDKMVFVQPIAHVSSEASKLVVNKVEKIEITKPRAHSESGITAPHSNHTDVVYMSKQATVKEIPSTTNSSNTGPSYSSSITVTDDLDDSDSSAQFVTSVMKRTSPQRAVIRQRSKDSDLLPSQSTFHSKPTKAAAIDESTSVASTSNAENVSSTIPNGSSEALEENKVAVQSAIGQSTHDLSSDSLSDENNSSHSSSLASLSNVVAPCGSIEDLDAVDNEVFPLMPDSPKSDCKEQEASRPDKGDLDSDVLDTPPTRVLFTTGNDDTSDLMRDITMSLDEALSSMDDLMSRGPSKQASSGLAKVSESAEGESETPSLPVNTHLEGQRSAEPAADSLSNAGGSPELEVSKEGSADTTTAMSNVLFYNEGRITFNFDDDGSILSKVSVTSMYNFVSGCCLFCFFTSSLAPVPCFNIIAPFSFSVSF